MKIYNFEGIRFSDSLEIFGFGIIVLVIVFLAIAALEKRKEKG